MKDWLRNGWLTEHRTSRQEIEDLLVVAGRDLKDCRTEGLSPEWRLAIAYNAALQVATAALAACGYRAAREAHHYRAIQSLAHTMSIDSQRVAQLDAFRKKRNISGYERAGGVSEKESREMRVLAEALRDEFDGWMKKHHKDLLQ